jgi:diguanylate cyclase (GGDEF)-like protein
VPILSQRQAAIATSVEALAATPLFRGLDETDLEILAQHAIDETYDKGRVIVREGSAAQSVYVIVAGRVRITETSRETQAELQLSELGPGQVFGELGALRNQPRVANVVAVEKTRCLVVPPASFLQALERVPRLALGLLQVLAARLADADRRVARFAPDPLTGLMSSRAFQDQYRRLAASSRRRGTGALLLVLDVRHLRAINDQFGYAVGDEVLKSVAEALVETTRSTDVVCRYGADEFAALLVDVVVGDTERLVTRVEKRLSDTSARRSLPLEIRCSIGASFSPTPPHECADLMREADLDLRRRRSLAT